MQSPTRTVLCAVSHAQQDPWFDIWVHGQCVTWQTIEDTSEFKIINFFGRKASKLTKTLDAIHERIRWSNRYLAKVLKLFDALTLSPFLFLVPKFKRDLSLSRNHDSFVVDFPDTFVTYRWKMLSLIKFFIEETDFDFLYVTSTSSYIRPAILLEQCKDYPQSGVYLGPLPYEGAKFVSGSSRLLSRDVAQIIWDNRLRFKISVIEDQAMAELLSKYNIYPSHLPLYNVDSREMAGQRNEHNSAGIFHFRLKTIVNGKRDDVMVMKTLHQQFKKEIH